MDDLLFAHIIMGFSALFPAALLELMNYGRTEDFVGCWLDSNGNTINVFPSRASNSWLARGLSTELHGIHSSCDPLVLLIREIYV